MIEITGLRKSYGTRAVLRGVDLHAAQGGILAVLGPNGAGKTTTVRILATLLRPDAGTVRVAGADAVTEPHVVRRRLALTGQYAALDGAQTGRENLVMIARLAGLNRRAARARAAELLDRFDLEAPGDRRVETYSGGMRRRLDLAASLVARPSVVVLDEPTTGLDPRSRLELWSVVGDLAADGTTVLLTTQYLEEADRLADTVAVIDGGVVVAHGTAAQLKQRVAGSRLDLVGTDRAAFVELCTRLADRALDADPASSTVSMAVDGDAASIRRALDALDPAGDLVARFALHQASLDDVFLSLTGRPTSAQEPAHV